MDKYYRNVVPVVGYYNSSEVEAGTLWVTLNKDMLVIVDDDEYEVHPLQKDKFIEDISGVDKTDIGKREEAEYKWTIENRRLDERCMLCKHSMFVSILPNECMKMLISISEKWIL